jgi:hypothetical protein
MKTEEQTIPGEMKIFEVDHEFTFRGEKFTKGERLEVSADDAKQLMSLRVLTAFGDSKLHVPAGRLTGVGNYTLERCPDGAHKMSLWHKSYLESDDWVKVEFLEDVHGWGIKAGDRRRLRRSDALERPHKYINSPAPSPSQAMPPSPARILILEPRPRPTMTPEERAEREAAVMAGLERERSDGWVSGLKRI